VVGPEARLSRLIAHTGRWRVALPVLALALGVYLGVLHPWLVNWGATELETPASLPGDTSCWSRGCSAGSRNASKDHSVNMIS
jgi:hypothetical protein